MGLAIGIARIEQRHRSTARNARDVVLDAATIAVAGRGWDGCGGLLRLEYRQGVYLPSRDLAPVVARGIAPRRHHWRRPFQQNVQQVACHGPPVRPSWRGVGCYGRGARGWGGG